MRKSRGKMPSVSLVLGTVSLACFILGVSTLFIRTHTFIPDTIILLGPGLGIPAVIISAIALFDIKQAQLNEKREIILGFIFGLLGILGFVGLVVLFMLSGL